MISCIQEEVEAIQLDGHLTLRVIRKVGKALLLLLPLEVFYASNVFMGTFMFVVNGDVHNEQVVLAPVGASEVGDMLHIAMALSTCALHQNLQNVKDLQTCRKPALRILISRSSVMDFL